MTALRVAQARFVGLFRKEQLEQELDEELRFHLAMRTQENIRRGMSAADASRTAARAFGNLEAVKDACRDVSGGGAAEVFWQDVRFAVRMLLKDRAFTVIAVLALALGIGANTALFTVMSSVLLRPLPFPHPDRLMAVWSEESGHPESRYPFAYPELLDLQQQNNSFESLGGYERSRFVLASNGGAPVQINGAIVTSETLHLLGVKPAIGRIFTAADDEPGSKRTIVISHELWESQFEKAANITNATLTLDSEEYAIIGVMPSGFAFPVQNNRAQCWTTFARYREVLPNGAPAPTTRRDAHYVSALGLLKAGVSREQAEADVRGITGELAAKHPETSRRFNYGSVTPWLADLTREVRPALLMLIGGAICLLCIACANIANLLLARASTRQKEIAVRSALGAGRSRILRQLLTESLLLACVGGFLGLLFAFVGTSGIVALLPANFPRAGEIVPDMRVLAFTGVITVITSCVFGFAPAWRSARCELGPVLNDCSRGPTETPRGRRTRSLLVGAEMVLAFMLLAAAGFFLRNLWQLQRASPGFNPEKIITAELSLPATADSVGARNTVNTYERFLARLATLPGLQAVSAVTPLPMSGFHPIADYGVEGRQLAKADLPRSEPHIVARNYFKTMEIPLTHGRDFDERDHRDAPPVVIINESLARASFPGENPIGKRISPGLTDNGIIIEREIVGVVADMTCDSLRPTPLPEVYLPHAQCAADNLVLVARTDIDAETFLAVLRDVGSKIAPNLAIEQPRTMDDYLDAAVAQPRLNSTLIAVFALVAVVLTAIGVYGVMAYSVAQRRHEIGIRLALGAQKVAVFRLVIGHGVRLIACSMVAGVACAGLISPMLQRFSHGAATGQGATIAFVAFLLSAIACLACWLPAHRASMEDPLVAIGQR